MRSTFRIAFGAAVSTLVLLASALPSQALSFVDGDLIAVVTKSGVDAIVRLSGFNPAVAQSVAIDLTAAGGDAAGAKLNAFRVESVTRTEPVFGLPQADITFSSPDALSIIDNTTDLEISVAANVVGPAGGWFSLVNTSATGGPILSNTAAQLTVQVGATFSYTNFLGFGGINDKIGNSVPFNTACGIGASAGQSPACTDASVPIYRTLQGFPGLGDYGLPEANERTLLGSLSVSGATLTYTPIPEPGTLLLLGAGLLGLAAAGHKRTV